MPTRKIKDIETWKLPCYHPEHNPPSAMVYKPGTYEHICPGCGNRIVFTVPVKYTLCA
jgi:rRNA maturation endonuclease Nob1